MAALLSMQRQKGKLSRLVLWQLLAAADATGSERSMS
jgi:hypothetical protein